MSKKVPQNNLPNYLPNYLEEMRSAYLYRHLAKIEVGTPREKLFNSLAHVAEKQAAIWIPAVESRPVYRPDVRTWLVTILLRLIGPERMLSVLAAMKVRGISVYSGHERPVTAGAMERRHRASSAGGNLRAAVFGANDGLLSNASLMLGVAGGVQSAAGDSHMIVISGMAGLLAGAFSMGAGEYVSVRSQRELYEYQIGLEREELKEYPHEEAMELALIYEAKGIAPEDARKLGAQIIADPERALDTLAREELGLNPQDLGSPWGAASSSFFSFAAGALVPLLPFLIFRGNPHALSISIGATAGALFLLGCALSLFTGKRAWVGGLRMLVIGAFASGFTWVVGSLLGGFVR
jgi:VIT1/CCC1 family predicted Fe2+/Mn2+ transporter